jgi:DNA mismatch repair protein MutL
LPGRIVILPDDLTNKIAAGEVIERPASIVKELLENALDAGATDITVELMRGGCGSIRVTDNGEGIEPEDAALAFYRYATSKIYYFDDIYKVYSFGFRGEALPSIASVSRVELITRKRNSLSGTRVIAESGEIREIAETGCPEGTSVSVTRIFEPVPVRRKFLKSELTEQGHCMDVISRLALSNPGVRLTVIANGREILNVPATKDAGERLALVLGADFLDQMLFFSGEGEGMKIHGFTSSPSLTRANARHIYCFVNKRFIRDHQINHAVMTAYRHLIEGKRYPACVLFVDISPYDVDVNVHPAKLEVRFRNPRELYQLVVGTLSIAMGGVPVSPALRDGADVSEDGQPVNRAHQAGVEEALKRYSLFSGGGRQFPVRPVFNRPESPFHLYEQRESPACVPITFTDLDFVGQAGGTYLIFQSKDRMILLDQHAAHERILFENLKKKAAQSDNPPVSQRLLLPEVISLSPRDFDIIQGLLPILAAAGFEMEPFGRDTLVVKAVPAGLSLPEPKRVLMDFLEEYTCGESATLDEKREKIYAFLACKGAVKAGQRLSSAEVTALCADLDSTPHAQTCPHGRPVFISFTFYELEKMFGRR